jgi:hypothetical protein
MERIERIIKKKSPRRKVKSQLYSSFKLAALIFIGIVNLNTQVSAGVVAGQFSERSDKKEIRTRVFEIPTKLGAVKIEIHGSKPSSAYIGRVEEILREDASKIFDYFEYKPTTPIHFVINNDTVQANGAATVFPRNLIELNSFPPLGTSHLVTGGDWIRGLVLHELIHIVHMDQTDGLLNIIRSVFGSVGKLGGVVPRWFAEGIAVWGETYFTRGGRLRHQGMRTEFLERLKDPLFCQTVDCLDQPGQYPYGQYPYWVGGMFLSYWEHIKPGAIRCFVKRNARKIPFFLNPAFRECVGQNAEESFAIFREATLKDLEQHRKQNDQHNLMADLKQIKLEKVYWQKDFQLVGEQLFYLRDRDQAQRFVSHNLATGEWKEEKLDFYVDHLNLHRDELHASTSTYLRYLSPRKSHKRVGENWLEIPLKKGGDYAFSLPSGDTYFWRHRDHQWVLWINQQKEGKKERDERELLKLAPNQELKAPRSFEWAGRQWLVFATYLTENKKHPFQIWGFDLGEIQPNPYILYQNDKPIEILEQCEGSLFFRTEPHKLSVIEMNQADQVRLREVVLPLLEDVAKVRMSESYTTLQLTSHPGTLFYKDQGCSSIREEILSEVDKDETYPLEKNRPPLQTSVLSTNYYPALRHFTPHWWFLSFYSDSTLSSWSVTTSINDPKNIHSLNLDLTTYPDLDETTPNFSYIYDWGGTKLGLSMAKNFVKSSLRQTHDENESQLISISHDFDWPGLYWSPRFSYGLSKETDYIGERESKVSSLQHVFYTPFLFADDFFQGNVTWINNSHHKTKYGKKFWSMEGKNQLSLQYFRRFYNHLTFSKSKLFKDGLVDGVVFGGGVNDIDSGSFHPFYGLSHNDAFGNEITSAQFRLDWQLIDTYTGWGLFPLYIKQFHLLAGTDYLKTDYIYIESKNRFLRDSDIQNVHTGVQMDMTLFYVLPMEVDFIYSKIIGNDLTSESTFTSVLKGSIWF